MVTSNWLEFGGSEYDALAESELALTRRSSSGVNDIESSINALLSSVGFARARSAEDAFYDALGVQLDVRSSFCYNWLESDDTIIFRC